MADVMNNALSKLEDAIQSLGYRLGGIIRKKISPKIVEVINEYTEKISLILENLSTNWENKSYLPRINHKLTPAEKYQKRKAKVEEKELKGRLDDDEPLTVNDD